MLHFIKKHEKSSIWPKLKTFRANYHVWPFWSIFRQKVAKSTSFRQKEPKIVDLAKTCNFSRKILRFGVLVNFSNKTSKKFLISPKGTKNRRFGKNLQLLEQTITFRRFPQLFRKMFPEVTHFAKNHKTSSISPKLSTYRSKLSRFAVLVNFSTKTCKKCLISRKSTKNRRFGQNLQLFAQNITFRRFGQLFSKKLQKVPYFARKNQKSSIWPKLETSRAKYHLSAFWSTFKKKVPKCTPFPEKARKIVDLAKT